MRRTYISPRKIKTQIKKISINNEEQEYSMSMKYLGLTLCKRLNTSVGFNEGFRRYLQAQLYNYLRSLESEGPFG